MYIYQYYELAANAISVILADSEGKFCIKIALESLNGVGSWVSISLPNDDESVICTNHHQHCHRELAMIYRLIFHR